MKWIIFFSALQGAAIVVLVFRVFDLIRQVRYHRTAHNKWFEIAGGYRNDLLNGTPRPGYQVQATAKPFIVPREIPGPENGSLIVPLDEMKSLNNKINRLEKQLADSKKEVQEGCTIINQQKTAITRLIAENRRFLAAFKRK